MYTATLNSSAILVRRDSICANFCCNFIPDTHKLEDKMVSFNFFYNGLTMNWREYLMLCKFTPATEINTEQCNHRIHNLFPGQKEPYEHNLSGDTECMSQLSLPWPAGQADDIYFKLITHPDIVNSKSNINANYGSGPKITISITISNRVLVYMNNKVWISECSWYTSDLTNIQKVVAPNGQRGRGRRARHVPASPTAGAPPCRRKPLLPCAAGSRSRCSSVALIRQGTLRSSLPAPEGASPCEESTPVWQRRAAFTNPAWWTRLMNEQLP